MDIAYDLNNGPHRGVLVFKAENLKFIMEYFKCKWIVWIFLKITWKIKSFQLEINEMNSSHM